MMTVRSVVAAVVLGAVAAGLVAAGVLGVAHVRTLRRDIPPVGPACLYETDVGSGAAGTGVERVDRFPWPERTCVAPDEEGREVAQMPVERAMDELDSWVRAGFFGLVTGVAVVVVTLVVAGQRARRPCSEA